MKIDVNVAGQKAATGGAKFSGPEGAYKVRCVDVSEKTSDDGSATGQPRLHLVVVEPAGFAGAPLAKTLPAASNPQGGAFWRAALESLGKTATELDKGAISIDTDQLFKGKEMHIYFRPKGPGEQYDSLEFITAGTYRAAKKPNLSEAASNGSAPSATQVPVSTSAGFEGGN
jgi:hypothetical protein